MSQEERLFGDAWGGPVKACPVVDPVNDVADFLHAVAVSCGFER